MDVQAKLDEVCARGPWHTRDGDITGDQLRAVYEAVAKGGTRDMVNTRICRAVGVTNLSDDRSNRALQHLRKAGLIECRKGHGWIVPR